MTAATADAHLSTRDAAPAILNLEWHSTPTEWPIRRLYYREVSLQSSKQKLHFLCVIGWNPSEKICEILFTSYDVSDIIYSRAASGGLSIATKSYRV